MAEQRGEGTASRGTVPGATQTGEASDGGPADETPGGRDDARTGGPRQVTIRRAPRYRAFVLTGVMVGALIGITLAVGAPVGGHYSARTLLGYLGVSLALLGGLLGGLVAVVVERPRRR